jgi:hypothetical protein
VPPRSSPTAVGDTERQRCGLLDSRQLDYRGGRNGRGGNWVDRAALQRICRTQTDEIHHLAKVRVAGSNPVFPFHRSRSGERGGPATRRRETATQPPGPTGPDRTRARRRQRRPRPHAGRDTRAPGRTPPENRGGGAHGSEEAGLLGAWKKCGAGVGGGRGVRLHCPGFIAQPGRCWT